MDSDRSPVNERRAPGEPNEMNNIGVIHGRFQPLHNDHMKYLMAGWERCRHMFVGISNPDPGLTRTETADAKRGTAQANPLTYFERYALLRDALFDEGLDQRDFSVVPFPINVPELIRYYVPLDAMFFLTIYDDWGRKKLELLQSMGLKTDVMWDRPIERKGLTGSELRDRMVADLPWEHLVPRTSALLLKEWEIPRRIRNLRQGGAGAHGF
jgi:nicotinamide mononucleotide adenylyltransferase